MKETKRRIGWLTVAMAGLFLLAAPFAAQGENPFAIWAKKMPIRFAGYTQAGTLTNFPVLVQFAQGSNSFSYADMSYTNGADLRFTASDETTELNYEIESWNTGGVSYVWVLVPTLADSNTAIRAFYGNASPGTTVATNQGAVWSANYAGVWHLSSFGDSTSNRNNATDNGTASATGMVASGHTLDATPHWAEAADTNNTLDMPSAVTLSAWIKPTAVTSGTYQMLITKNPSGTAGSQYGGNFEWRLFAGTMQLDYQTTTAANGTLHAATVNVTSGIWQHVAVSLIKSPASGTFYINGASAGTFTPDATFGVWTNNEPVRIGRRKDTSNYFAGVMDEVEIANTPRAANWIWANWMNQASNRFFNAYGTAALQDQSKPVIANLNVTNVLDTTADLVCSLSQTGSSPTTVYAFYGPTDQTTNRTWAFTNSFSPSVLGILTNPATSLASNTLYAFTFYATNTSGDCWGGSTGRWFHTLGLPVVSNDIGATNVDLHTATLWGRLTTGTSARVVIYCGTDPNAWTYTNDCGTVTQGTSFSANLTGLKRGTTYYYRSYATNFCGDAWAPVVSFTMRDSTFTSWRRTMTIRLPGYTQAETLTNFPVLVVFSNGMDSGFNYADFLSAPNQDLRFAASNETDELNYEVESWDTSGASYVWVQVPRIAGTNTTIYAYWGNPGQTAPTYTTNGATWANGHAGVWHLATANGALSGLDASASQAHGTVSGATATPGISDGAGLFNGSLAGVALQNGSSGLGTLQLPMTISAWFKASTTNGGQAIFGQYAPSVAQDQLVKLLRLDWGTLKYYASTAVVAPGNIQSGGTFFATSNAWHFASVVVSGTTSSPSFLIYMDGQSQVPTMTSANALSPTPDATVVNWIGRDTSGDFFSGAIDEVRVSNVARSTNWLWACFMNQASNGVFANYGATASQNTDWPAINNAGGATNVLPVSAVLNGNLTSTGGADTYVWVYWDTVNRGTNKTWAFTNDFISAQSIGSFSYPATNLTPDTWCWYSYYASNSAGHDAWAGSMPFKTPGQPGVDNSIGPTNVLTHFATIWGGLTNGVSAHCYLYWGTNQNAWTYTNDFGSRSEGTVSTNLTALKANTTYYYRTYATNDYGDAWAPVTNFTTMTKPVGAKTWDGGAGTPYWFDAANWDPDGSPGSGSSTDWVLLDNNAPAIIDLATRPGGQYPYWRLLEITKSDGDLIFQSAASCYVTGPTGLYFHTTSPRTVSFSGAIASDSYNPHTYRVDGTGNVFSISLIQELNGGLTQWSKTGSGQFRAGYAWNATLTNILIEGVLTLPPYYNYGCLGGGAQNATVNLASNGVLWSQASLIGLYAAAGGPLYGTSFSGDGTIMLNSSLNGNGTVYGTTSAGGRWMPGGDGRAGKLTVYGNLAFATNAGPTLCTLKIDVTGTGTTAGVDYDQLFITNGAIMATSLTNVNLVVTVASSASTAGKTYRIIDDVGTDFSGAGKAFNSVTWNGVLGLTGTVNRANGYVELNSILVVPRGLAIFFR